MQGHLAVIPGPVHGVDIGIEEDLVEVPDEDGQRGENRFIEMDGDSDVQPPAWQEVADGHLGPEHDSGDGHDDDAPDQSPVFRLLGVREAFEFGPGAAQPEIAAKDPENVGSVLGLGNHIADQFAAVASQHRVDDVVYAGTDQNYCGDAVNDAAHLFAHTRKIREPGIGIFQSEPGNDQNDERSQQREVLPALAGGHAGDGAGVSIAKEDGFAPPDDEIVQQHGADIGGKRCVHVDFAQGKFLGDSGVALAAGVDQVVAGDGGTGIAGGQNVVDTVAAGAVGNDVGAALGGKSVVAGKVGAGAAALDAKLLRQAHAFVAAGAGGAGEILRGDRGVGIEMRFDGVNAVAIGADRGQRVAASHRLAVNALHEPLFHRAVALGASGRDVELENGRFR